MKITAIIRNNSITALLTAVLLILLQSCSGNIIYNQYQVIGNTVWDKDIEYYFTFNIEDISSPYDIIFEVRNDNFYPFRNLWIFYSEEMPVAPVLRDTLECTLADEYGKWTGKGFSLYESGFRILEKHYFPVKGQYSFCFRHGMRTDNLQGIQEIGLRVEKH